jgi:hypothetical protein
MPEHSLLIVAAAFASIGALHRLEAQALGSFSEGTSSGWTLSAGLGQGWESNVRFASPEGEGDLTTRARVEGARLWRTRRDRVALAVGGALIRFRSLSDLNRSAYSASLDATRALTRRTSTRFDYRMQSDLTSRSVTSSGEGSLLPGLVSAHSHTANLALAYRATRLVTTHVDARAQRVSFDAPALASGWLAVVGGDVTRRQSPDAQYSFGYEYRHSEVARNPFDAQQLTATSQHQLSEHLIARLTAGATFQSRVQSASGTHLVGGAALNLVNARDDFGAAYQRTVGQEFGRQSASAFTTDGIVLNYRRVLTRTLHVDAGGRQAWTGDTQRGDGRATSTEGTLNLRYVSMRGPALTVGAFARRRDDRFVLADRGMTIGIGYGWSQLRSVPAPNQPESP